MSINHCQHLITGDEIDSQAIMQIINLAMAMKENPLLHNQALKGKHIALLFEKPSLRTRFSFTAAVNQLGGHVIESVSQNRKEELPKDMIRVVQGYCDAVMIRTTHESILKEMQAYAKIPIINGLTDGFHPCQALADLMTLHQQFGTLDELSIAYLGDGNNVLHSLLMMANKLGVKVNYCCPEGHGPSQHVIDNLDNPTLANAIANPQQAVAGCHAVYTDVWTSMGFEDKDDSLFYPYQVNEELMTHANDEAVFMHCMPMVRGREVSQSLPDAKCSVIFQQSENRMHVQKALLVSVLTQEKIHA